MPKSCIILFCLLSLFPCLYGCRSKRVTVDASHATGRHSEGVAALRSVAARIVGGTVEVVTVKARTDTAGEMQVVAIDTVRTAYTLAEAAVTGDTARFAHSDTLTDTLHEENATQAARTATAGTRKGFTAFAVGIWFGFTLLVVLLVAILLRQWTSRH